MPLRRVGHRPLVSGGAGVEAGQVGLRAGLIQKNQSPPIDQGQPSQPSPTLFGYVGLPLFART